MQPFDWNSGRIVRSYMGWSQIWLWIETKDKQIDINISSGVSGIVSSVLHNQWLWFDGHSFLMVAGQGWWCRPHQLFLSVTHGDHLAWKKIWSTGSHLCVRVVSHESRCTWIFKQNHTGTKKEREETAGNCGHKRGWDIYINFLCKLWGRDREKKNCTSRVRNESILATLLYFFSQFKSLNPASGFSFHFKHCCSPAGHTSLCFQAMDSCPNKQTYRFHSCGPQKSPRNPFMHPSLYPLNSRVSSLFACLFCLRSEFFPRKPGPQDEMMMQREWWTMEKWSTNILFIQLPSNSFFCLWPHRDVAPKKEVHANLCVKQSETHADHVCNM